MHKHFHVEDNQIILNRIKLIVFFGGGGGIYFKCLLIVNYLELVDVCILSA